MAPLRLRAGPGHQALESMRTQVVDYLARGGGCPGRAGTYAVELVLEEWVTNVFRHGAGSEVAVEVTFDGRLVEMRFTDDGRAFDPTVAPERVLPATLDEAEPGGLGLFLIRRYSRRWRYAREAGRNVMLVEIDCTQP